MEENLKRISPPSAYEVALSPFANIRRANSWSDRDLHALKPHIVISGSPDREVGLEPSSWG